VSKGETIFVRAAAAGLIAALRAEGAASQEILGFRPFDLL
jgi:hypothetical protein